MSKSMSTATLIVGLVSIGMVGCSDATNSSSKRETTITTPGGTTTITIEKDVKTSGDDPPATKP